MARVMLAFVLLAAALAVMLPGSAAASKRCPSTQVGDRYLTLRANDVRVFGGTSCKVARIVIRRYFATVMDDYSGCATRRDTKGCPAYGYTCTTKGAGSAPLRGRCVSESNPARVVRFLEVDTSRA